MSQNVGVNDVETQYYELKTKADGVLNELIISLKEQLTRANATIQTLQKQIESQKEKPELKDK